MKRYLLLIVFILSSQIATNAQLTINTDVHIPWYYKRCGVVDINSTTQEEFKCLWDWSNGTLIGGGLITGLGIVFLVSGVMAEPSTGGTTNWINMDMDFGPLIIGMGIAVISIGSYRKSELRKTPGYDLMKSGSLNLSPVVGFNQYNGTSYVGMSLSLNF